MRFWHDALTAVDGLVDSLDQRLEGDAWYMKILRKIRRRLFTFIGLHYVYIFSMAFTGSVVLYAERNIRYIDALFLATAACTQAGMNTVNLNQIKLYQQITLYVLGMLTTPIFIHSSVVFVRLHWFEKKFDNIRENSKAMSRMRRTATMARVNSRDYRDVESLASKAPTTAMPSMATTEKTATPDVNGTQSTSSASSNLAGEAPPADRDIRFGILPMPRRQASVAPQDMYRSINMMQLNRRLSNDEGPALVIKSPQALDEENEERERNRILGTPSKSDSSDTSANEPSSTGDDTRRLLRSVSHDVGLTFDTPKEPIALDKRANTVEGPQLAPVNSAPPVNGPPMSGFRQKVRRSRTLDQILSRTIGRSSIDERPPLNKVMSTNYLSWQPTVGRNSVFVDLTPEQKEELGGVEYRALKLLAKVLVGYYIGFWILAFVLYLPYAILRHNYSDHFREQGYTPTWWAFFTSMSAFSDLGLTLSPESFAFFENNVYVPLIACFFIIIGNTGFPCMLRFVIWFLFKITPKYGHSHETLGFLLDHPRRCFTLLFPSGATWLLVFILVALNGIDLVLFLVLDLTDSAIKLIPVGYRIMCGLFQAVSTRTAGFTIVNMSDVHPAVRVSYVIMMYISVFPIAISMRRTNVYEEQSIGVYYPVGEEGDEKDNGSHLASHLRRQLSFDLWFIFLGLFIVCIAEGNALQNNKYQIFDVLFEIVSAYGTVGVSMGAPGTTLSLSGAFNVIGKLVIIAMMLRGRHRGLPYSLDRAVIFKGELIERSDSIQQARARNRRLMSMNVPIHDAGISSSISGVPTDAAADLSGLRARRGPAFQQVPSQAVSDSS